MRFPGLPGLAAALAVLSAAGLLGAGAARAACPTDEQIDGLVRDWKAGTPTRALAAGAGLQDALCAQDGLVRRLRPGLGEVVGYKAGLTNKAVQQRFGVSEPVRGQLLAGMLLKDGAEVPAGFGARPLYEADLLVIVADEGINQATTAEEAIRHVSAIRPFIELPDLALREGEPMDGAVLTAINVGARAGVMGPEMPLAPTPEAVRDLAAMTVVVTDGTGARLAEGKGEAVLGNPLNAVLWVARSLAAEGRRLKAGDMVSVGSFSPMMPPKAGQAVTVRYEGLPGTPQVSVRFR
ncbi:2-keto-4-pentenoate hydratase [Arenibaculum pallidiluteum]|uniref:2-keto-4-pentenoate hydratase n=1 Tax=Arenibaculum pallidiluteum TaxID=2812559 RepID=UPI001A968810|nr:hypothetical protein [Arenibaculum pallidiluteum]